jgi:hypothetical protein
MAGTRTTSLLRDVRRGLGYILHEPLLAQLLAKYGSLMFFAAVYTVPLALVGVEVLGTSPGSLACCTRR